MQISRYDIDVAQEYATACLWRVRELMSDGRPLGSAKQEAFEGLDIRHLSREQQKLTVKAIEGIDYHDVGRKACNAMARVTWDYYEREFLNDWSPRRKAIWKRLYLWFGIWPGLF